MRAGFIALVVLLTVWVMMPLGARLYDVMYPWEVPLEPAVLENQNGKRIVSVGDELRWRGLYMVRRKGCAGVWRSVLEVIDPATGAISPSYLPSHAGSFELIPGRYPLYKLVVESVPASWAGAKLRYRVTAEVDCWPHLTGTTQHLTYRVGEARVAP